jgi:hypothetical protein
VDDVWRFLRLAVALEKRFIRQKTKTAWIANNCPAHFVDVKLTAKNYFLQQNMTRILQP